MKKVSRTFCREIVKFLIHNSPDIPYQIESKANRKRSIKLVFFYLGRELNWKVPENAPKGVPGIEYRASVDAAAAGDN